MNEPAPQLVVTARWDPEALVWVATSDDVPGLVVEADTADQLIGILKEIVPQLLIENGRLEADEANAQGFRLQSFREELLYVA